MRSERARLLVAVATAGYVAAWVLGLLVAPAAPAADAAVGAVQRYYAGHTSAVLLQSLLVHGVAALALVAIALGLPRAARGSAAAAALVRGAGVLAAAVSLAQVGLEVDAATSSPGATAGLHLFHAVNDADSAKLLLLGVLVAAGTTLLVRTGLAGRALVVLTGVLAPLLPVSGAGYLLGTPALLDLLYLSLPLLLVWAGWVGVVVGRRPAPALTVVS